MTLFRVTSVLFGIAMSAIPGRTQGVLMEWPARHILPESTPTEVATVRASRPVFPIGNGRVFCYVGPGDPANRLFMLTGPHYQTRGNHTVDGAFGDHWLEVVSAGKVRRPARNSWSYGPGVVTGDVFGIEDELYVITDTRAPSVVLREVYWQASSDSDRLRMRFTSRRLDDSLPGWHEARYERSEGVTWWLAATFGSIDGGLLNDVQQDELGPYVEAANIESCAVTIAMATSRERARDLVRGQPAVEWSDPMPWEEPGMRVLGELPLDQGLPFDTADVHRVVHHCYWATNAQVSLPGGAVAPMISFKGVWVRDSQGPLETFLWNGQFDRARALLRYLRNASAVRRASQREFPLDLPVAFAPKSVDWVGTPVDRCEVPSLIVQMHERWFDVTGDLSLVREHWDWLRHNALNQELHEGPHGPLQTFNGDETWLHGAFYSEFPEKGSYPNGLPAVSGYSLYSCLTFVACQEAMARLAPLVGRGPEAAVHRQLADAMRRSIEKSFWVEDGGYYAPSLSRLTLAPHPIPFAPVSLAVASSGVLDPHSARVRRHMAHTMAALSRLDEGKGFRMTPYLERFTGGLPGELLRALHAVNAPEAEAASAWLLASAGYNGLWAEIHDPDGVSWGYGDGTLPNRARPWESGLNVAALLEWFTGAIWREGRVWLAPRHLLEAEFRIPVGRENVWLRWDAAERPVCLATRERVVGNLGDLLDGGRQVMAAPPPEPLPPATYDPKVTFPDAGADRRLLLAAGPGPVQGDAILDVGLPFTPGQLGAWLFRDDASRRFDVVEFDPSALAVDRNTLKPASFWQDAELTSAFERFERVGGLVLRPTILRDFQIAGPFPNPESRGLFEEARPLGAFDPDATFGDEAGWFSRSAAPDGRLDLHPPRGPQDGICCFARATFEAKGTTATLSLGTDDGCRVWLDGELVFEDIGHRHLTPGQFRIPLKTTPGRAHVLTIGVEDRHGGFGLHAALLQGR